MEESLLVCVTYNKNRYCTIDDYIRSLGKDELQTKLKERLGDSRAVGLLAYVSSQNIFEVLKVFGVRPLGQYKRYFGKKGRGIHVYEISQIEAAYLKAYEFAVRRGSFT